VILQSETITRRATLRQVGHESYESGWGFRDWVGKEKKSYPNRLSIVVGHRPVLISGNLKGVSIAQVIRRSGKIKNDIDNNRF
jgi:hypothetical protein